MAVIYQSVSHRCSKCGTTVDPLKHEVEQRAVERADGTLGLQYDHEGCDRIAGGTIEAHESFMDEFMGQFGSKAVR